jgi:cGMP-dependent protein kinase
VKLVKTLKDKNYIYYLMDYIKGKELYEVLLEIGILSKFQTQFYIGSMMLAVKYLHDRKFIFRDIRPENIMVLTNGYLKLIDFGTAKVLKDKTNSIIGTPQYMAPEVIMGDYYSYEIDYWSIGVCLYEFYCGNIPFGENANEPLDIYVDIIKR